MWVSIFLFMSSLSKVENYKNVWSKVRVYVCVCYCVRICVSVGELEVKGVACCMKYVKDIVSPPHAQCFSQCRSKCPCQSQNQSQVSQSQYQCQCRSKCQNYSLSMVVHVCLMTSPYST